jgi:hypothetical protein
MARPTREEMCARVEQQKKERDTLTFVSKQYGIPDLTLESLIKKNALTKLMDTPEDKIKLEFLKVVSRNQEGLTKILLRFPKKTREQMLSLTAMTPMETYAYKSYLAGHKELRVITVCKRLERVFGYPTTTTMKQMVKAMRSKAQNERYRLTRKEKEDVLSDEVFLE